MVNYWYMSKIQEDERYFLTLETKDTFKFAKLSFYDVSKLILRLEYDCVKRNSNHLQCKLFQSSFWNSVFRLVENKFSWFDSSKSFEVIIIWNWLEYLMNSPWNKCNFLKMHIFRWFWLEKIENNWSNKNSAQIFLTLILQYFVIIFHF